MRPLRCPQPLLHRVSRLPPFYLPQQQIRPRIAVFVNRMPKPAGRRRRQRRIAHQGMMQPIRRQPMRVTQRRIKPSPHAPLPRPPHRRSHPRRHRRRRQPVIQHQHQRRVHQGHLFRRGSPVPTSRQHAARNPPRIMTARRRNSPTPIRRQLRRHIDHKMMHRLSTHPLTPGRLIQRREPRQHHVHTTRRLPRRQTRPILHPHRLLHPRRQHRRHTRRRRRHIQPQHQRRRILHRQLQRQLQRIQPPKLQRVRLLLTHRRRNRTKRHRPQLL